MKSIGKIPPAKRTPIVAVGASAGGLEPIKALIRNIPKDTGLAFIIIQHLSKEYASQSEEVYANASALKVHIGEEGMKVEPNNVYFNPHNADLVIKDGFFKLIPRQKSTSSGLHLPINQFFKSLAFESGADCVGIVLSGTGSDGALGMKALKKAGAITIVQDPKTALYSAMPLAAMDLISADYVLPVEKMPAILASVFPRTAEYDNGHHSLKVKKISLDQKEQMDFKSILDKVRDEHGIDFADYKSSTLERRFKRRMDFCKVKTYKEYLEYIQNNPTELHLLYEDLTINVTQFFRDPLIFEYLKTEVLKKLVVNHKEECPIRIWVPGCATGEEAYSIAMIFFEILNEKNSKIQFQIFATDISTSALEKGRKGIYSSEIQSDVSPERLSKFFIENNGSYQINKSIRDCCLFAKHDVTNDPPFSRIDLISCRNLLIYLNPSLQKKVLDIFSYSLNLNGILVLGNSENISNSQGVFTCISKKYKIHSKTATSRKLPLQSSPKRSKIIQNLPQIKLPERSVGNDFKAEMDRIYTERFGHSGLLLNDRMEILQFYGNVSPFLEFTPGEATLSISKLISKSLFLELRSVLLMVKKRKKAFTKRDVRFKVKNKTKNVNIDIVPLVGPESITYFSIFFTDTSVAAKVLGLPAAKEPKSAKNSSASKRQSEILEAELNETKKTIQTIIDEQDIINEELQIVNEELMSSNEELQSSNEELQTAQEELQSTNEELRTLNEELNFRNNELDILSGDLNNILYSVATPILIIGGDNTIRRLTSAAQSLFNVVPRDIGRSFSNIKHNLKLENLESLIAETINSNSQKKIDVQDLNGNWYSLRISPYTTPDNRIDGVVCVLIDVNDAKTISEKIELEKNIAEAIIESVENPLLLLDQNCIVKSANHAFYKTFKLSANDTISHKVYNIDNGRWDIPSLRWFIERMTASSQRYINGDITHSFPNIGKKVLHLRGGPIARKDNNNKDIFLNYYLLSFEDFTDIARVLETEKSARKVAEKDQSRSEAELKDAKALSSDLLKEKEVRLKFISTLSHDLLTPLTVAKLNSELLPKKIQNNELVSKSSRTISRNIDRVIEMLSNLLSVSRMEAGRAIILKIEKCDISAIISKTLETLTTIHGDRFIYNNPKPIEGFWDPSALQRVIENLCSNAIKYGNDQPVSINLFSQEKYVQFSIHNEGDPIPIEAQATLFELFHRSDDAINSGKVGWGIGLTYVDEVVQAHKGTIQIQSAQDFGTSFIVTLPKNPSK